MPCALYVEVFKRFISTTIITILLIKYKTTLLSTFKLPVIVIISMNDWQIAYDFLLKQTLFHAPSGDLKLSRSPWPETVIFNKLYFHLACSILQTADLIGWHIGKYNTATYTANPWVRMRKLPEYVNPTGQSVLVCQPAIVGVPGQPSP